MFLGFGLDTWNILLLIFMGITAISAGFLVVSQKAIIFLQDEAEKKSKEELEKYKSDANKLISEANERAEESKAAAAKAHERAVTAELKTEQLRKELGPRHLQRDIFLKEIDGKSTAHVEIMYLRDDPECFKLSQEIWLALKDAKWDVDPPRPIPLSVSSDALQNPTSMTVDGQPSGVTVTVHSITQDELEATMPKLLAGKPWVETPWTALMHALGASIGQTAGHAGGPNAPPEGTLRVIVAPRA